MAGIYRMTVDLNVLDHSGINLYSDIAAVHTEAVANACDADVETVDIKIDPEGNWMEIVDDSVGMSIDYMNDKHLRVGCRRRDEDVEHGKTTANGRFPMTAEPHRPFAVPAAAILDFLTKRASWHAKADILGYTNVTDGRWNAAIADLISGGRVVRQGEKRGALYRAVGADR